MRVAVGQMNSTASVAENLDTIARLAAAARAGGAEFLALPENAPQLAPDETRLASVESLDGPQITSVRALAREHSMAIALGSFAEVGPDTAHSYNTSVLIGPDGAIAGVYRKMHLFDVAVSADTSFRESDSVAAGPPEPIVAELAGWKFGLSVCYDLRFPELYRALATAGANLILVPSAFTFRTGAAHWSVLLRARAIENQCYVIAAGQVGRHYGSRESWGHSMIIDPWGDVIGMVGHGSELAFATVDAARVASVRSAMPCGSHRRI